jgi:hypothetical protein
VVQRVIVQDFPRADISVSSVWINMLAHDSEGAARVSARIIEDPRVRHFYDPERRVGKVIAKSLGGRETNEAWDIYLFYEKGSEWIEDLPTPTDWMHQLTGTSWADLAQYYTGDELVEELHKAMRKLKSPQRPT